MAERKPKKQITTMGHVRRWRAASLSLKASTYVCPLVPFGIILGINWSDWFGSNSTQQNGWSLGLGFGMLLVSLFSTILSIAKRDDLFTKSISGLFYVAILFAAWGVTFMFLASIMNEFGKFFIYFAISIAGSGSCDQVNKSYCQHWLDFYKNLADQEGLSGKGEKEKEARDQAHAEHERKYRPHD